MLVDDYDDERTLDEEEDMEEGTDREQEIDNLEKEQDMPIAQLLAMYGGYPPEEGEGEVEEQANGESERNRREKEHKNRIVGAMQNEAVENETEDHEEPEVISSRSSTSEENVNNHEKIQRNKKDTKQQQTIGSKRSCLYSRRLMVAQTMKAVDLKRGVAVENQSSMVQLEPCELQADPFLASRQEGIKPEVKPERKRREKTSELAQLYADMDTNGDTPTPSSSRSLRCVAERDPGEPETFTVGNVWGVRNAKVLKEFNPGHRPLGILSTGSSRQQSEEEEEDEGEYSGEEEDWHKTIMIGSAYQAQVPEGLQAYGATPPYENEDKLLWEPGKLSPKQVEEYLRALSHPPPGSQGVAAIPLGKHVRDDEQALYLLLQCGYNVDEALRRHRMNPTPLASTMTLWSEEECRNFENGLKTYGKDFHLIQQNKVRTRSVGELVQFYYLWKKTERHDLFATKTRIEKKKYIVHPGTTDYMDRFLDEGEGGGGPVSWRDNRSSSPSLHALLYGRPPPGSTAGAVGGGVEISASATVAQPTQSNPATEVSGANSNKVCEASVTYSGLNQMEDLARHLDPESLESLAKMTSPNTSVSIARTAKRTNCPHPMDVDVSISRSSLLASQTIGVEAKSVAMAETVAQ